MKKMALNFKDYKGRSLEEVAVLDYPSLDTLETNLLKRGDQNSPLLKRIQSLKYLLNNFRPAFPCHSENCQNLPDYIALSVKYTGKDIRGISIPEFSPKPLILCDSHKEERYQESQLYPLAYDTILKFLHHPRRLINDLHRIFLVLTGFQGPETRENIIRHLNKLPTRYGGIQLELF
jgi:hypothetical protein